MFNIKFEEFPDGTHEMRNEQNDVLIGEFIKAEGGLYNFWPNRDIYLTQAMIMMIHEKMRNLNKDRIDQLKGNKRG